MEPSEESALGPVLPARTPPVLSSPSWTLAPASCPASQPPVGPHVAPEGEAAAALPLVTAGPWLPSALRTKSLSSAHLKPYMVRPPPLIPPTPYVTPRRTRLPSIL